MPKNRDDDRRQAYVYSGALALYRAALCALSLVFTMAVPATAAAAIAYVQGAYVTGTTTATATVKYGSAQNAGDLNVVVIAWVGSTPTVQSVTDSKGNAYAAASAATIDSGVGAQQIWYAKNIVSAAANSNTVTITFNTAVSDSDIRIVEYSGIDTVNASDGGVGASGTGTAQNSGSLTTTNANDLLVAGNFIAGTTTAVGSGFTQRLLTNYDEIVEDEVVTAIGSYSATATQNSSGYWLMQMAAFRAAGSGGDTTPPTAPGTPSLTVASSSQINLSWIASTDNVGVTGYRVERCSGASCTSFAQVGTATTNSYSDTGLTASTSYSYRVRATDAAGNLSSYSSTASATTSAAGSPTIGSFTPKTGPVGTVITVTGTNLSNATQAWVGSAHDAAVTNISSTSMQMTVPADAPVASDQLAIVTPGGTVWSGQNFTVTTSGDTTPPTAPGTPSLTVVSSTQINLSWAASTDNVGVTGYLIQSCQGASCSNFAQIASVGGTVTTYNNTGLTASSSYSYQVQATDAAGNLSSDSNIATAITSAAGDTQPPSIPTNLTATAGPMDTTLTWTASTDNVGVTGYFIERCEGVSCTSFAQIAAVAGTTTTYTDSGITADANYSYRVRATDAAGNLSGYSSTIGDTPLDCD